ncbi:MULTISPECIES: hypothetical protein [unclassified Paenibacillus]|uniref:hypothetical protein n=1 Tax=unclassified Paenibacillus TaxID=185978 RepID=UPI00362DD23A
MILNRRKRESSVPRRPLSHLSQYGVTHLYRKNPLMVAWWSAAFPGFGHFLLNQYARACLLTLWELFINSFAHINEAMLYSFCGDFKMAKAIINPQWVFAYMLIYLFSIWDSYRSTVEANKLCELAEMENARIDGFIIRPLGIQYLEKKSPLSAAFSSFFFPGLGQLYNHRFGLAFYAMFSYCIYIGLSHSHEAVIIMMHGRIRESTAILHPHWLLFMPSIVGGSIYHAYISAVEHNRLFRIEQRQFLAERYGFADSSTIFH